MLKNTHGQATSTIATRSLEPLSLPTSCFPSAKQSSRNIRIHPLDGNTRTERIYRVAKTPLSPKEITLLVEKELQQAGIDDMRDQGAREVLAEVVNTLNKKHGLSMRKIAGELGISKSSVQNIVSGK
jgi:hypothetical protein